MKNFTQNRRRTPRTAFAVCSMGIVLVGAITGGQLAHAADSGSVSLSVNVAPLVRSVTVAAGGSGTYTSCSLNGVLTGITLSAPNGICTTDGGQITVTLGEVSSEVRVSTSNMTATGGTPWTPVSVLPGQDRFKLEIRNPYGAFDNVIVTGTPTCDTATFINTPVAGCFTIPANSHGVANLKLTGPSVVSSIATSAWTHTVTWQAIPPTTGV